MGLEDALPDRPLKMEELHDLQALDKFDSVTTSTGAPRGDIQHPDMMLAGVARSLDVPIVTSDSGFERINGLETENPREIY